MRLNKRLFSHDSCRGALLVEVLIAVVILAVALTLVIRSYLTSYRAIVDTAEYTTAMLLAEKKMQEVTRGFFIEDIPEEEGAFPAPYEEMRYHVLTAAVDGEPHLQRLNCEVQWPSGQRTNRIDVTTYVWLKENEE